MAELAEPGGRVLGLRLRCGGADEGGGWGVLRLADGGLQLRTAVAHSQKRVPALRNESAGERSDITEGSFLLGTQHRVRMH